MPPDTYAGRLQELESLVVPCVRYRAAVGGDPVQLPGREFTDCAQVGDDGGACRIKKTHVGNGAETLEVGGDGSEGHNGISVIIASLLAEDWVRLTNGRGGNKSNHGTKLTG